MATKGYSEEEAIAYIATHGLVERRLRRRAGEVVKREPKKNNLPNQNSDSCTLSFPRKTEEKILC
ncbi:hypothetical protein [Candidatus Berkiella aquae]|uniref:Uncharacterized protein n=1 Tax=Candidatus Berkiella aquae TaxID=295108 RepID=A0A0Q9YSD2_9GAMM|nr:hypothetical protein [Candidatus Berkiella aquae]MCS5710819.1 hypothetical protein [Candidatus Berkiella aquae]